MWERKREEREIGVGGREREEGDWDQRTASWGLFLLPPCESWGLNSSGLVEVPLPTEPSHQLFWVENKEYAYSVDASNACKGGRLFRRLPWAYRRLPWVTLYRAVNHSMLPLPPASGSVNSRPMGHDLWNKSIQERVLVSHGEPTAFELLKI